MKMNEEELHLEAEVILSRKMMLCTLDFSGPAPQLAASAGRSYGPRSRSGLSEGEFISLGHFEQQDLKVRNVRCVTEKHESLLRLLCLVITQ